MKGKALRKDANERILGVLLVSIKSNNRKILSWEKMQILSSNKGVWKKERKRLDKNKLQEVLITTLKTSDVLQEHTSKGR